MTSGSASALARVPVLAAALAVEFVDEFADGAKGAAVPLIRHDLALSYWQIGLLASVPLVAGSLLELPIPILAGAGPWRRRTVLGGGAVFIAALLAVAAARSFGGLLIAFVVFFPASGAFVSLTQAALMDADPGRLAQHMARWNLAGSAGSVAGPLLLAVVLACGGGWRAAYLVLAAGAAVAWLGAARTGRRPAADKAIPRAAEPAAPPAADRPAGASRLDRLRQAAAALRRADVLRWVVLLQIADLLLDVLTGFLALYFVDVVHATPAQAAIAVAVRLAAGLAGNTVLVGVLERVGGRSLLRASAVAAALLYPGFLLAPGLVPKLVVLAALSAATAPWYPVLQSELYRSLPGRSGVAVSLTSAAGLVGGLGPLAVGLVAQRAGLLWAMGCLTIVPLALWISISSSDFLPHRG